MTESSSPLSDILENVVFEAFGLVSTSMLDFLAEGIGGELAVTIHPNTQLTHGLNG